MAPTEWDVPLFEVPERYRPPKRKAKFPVWREWKGARQSCDDCILALARGEARFMAEPAMYVRADEQGRSFLCPRHAHDRKVRDR